MNRIQEKAIIRHVLDGIADGKDAKVVVEEAITMMHVDVGYAGGLGYLKLHPELTDDQAGALALGCCYGTAFGGITHCVCWEPIYDVDQANPVPAGVPRLSLPARASRCHDCAFRRDSKERSDEYEEEELLALAATGDPFWCHQGMRRPALWRHPVLGDVPGDPSNWTPAQLDGVPYQADGTPGLLCAGWAAERRKAIRD